MAYASVDIGSNTIRLLIAQEEPGGSILPLRHERVITRIARKIEETGMLDPEGAENTITALEGFRRMIDEAGVPESRVFAAGTSALREAEDAMTFIERIKAATGFQVRLLSGEEEAGVTARGVLSAFPGIKDAFVIDIGGGSTESIVVRGGRVDGSLSLPTGVVKLVDRHLRSDPPSNGELGSLLSATSAASREIARALGPALAEGSECMGTAGTPTTLAAIDLELEHYDRERVGGHSLALGRLREIFARLSGMTLSERGGIAGLEPGREDLIIAGTALTIGVMESLGFGRMLVSDAGLLEGLWLAASEGGLP